MQRLNTTVVAAAAALVLWALPVDAQDDLFVDQCRAITVSDATLVLPDESGIEQARRKRFSATGVLDLRFSVFFRSHAWTRFEVRVLTPNGHLYQSMVVPVGSTPKGAAKDETERRVSGYPFPLTVATPKMWADESGIWERVDVLFPVGGTAIVFGSLYGRWRVEVWPESAGKPCVFTTFSIVF